MPPPVTHNKPRIKVHVPDHHLAPEFLGVDPGKNGGAAVVCGSQVVDSICFGNATDQQIWEFFNNHSGVRFAVIEKVGGYIGRPQSGSMMFTFGDAAGFVRCCAVGNRIPFELKQGGVWQKALAIPPRKKGKKQQVPAKKGKNKGKLITKEIGGENYEMFKRRLHKHAQQLFPKAKVTPGVADAVLIAEYCRRTHGAA